jgi:hypothetical protein
MGKREWLLVTFILLKECGQTKITKEKEPKCALTLEQSLFKSIQSCKNYYNKSLSLSELFKVFESYLDASS